MYPYGFIRLDEDHLWDFIAKRKELQYKAALPYMREPAKPTESEPELRKRVREALHYLSQEERMELRRDIEAAYRDLQRKQHNNGK